jgi:hypothetical protein
MEKVDFVSTQSGNSERKKFQRARKSKKNKSKQFKKNQTNRRIARPMEKPEITSNLGQNMKNG